MKHSNFQKLNVIDTEHDKVWCYCPFHKDSIRPNLSISLVDKYYGRYKCWACQKEGYLSKAQMSKLSLSNIVYKNDKHNLQTLWRQFAESCKKNLRKFPLLKLGLAKQLNISIKSLDEWLIGYDGQAFTIPMFREDLNEYCRESGICGIQRRFPDGTKRCVEGSRLGFMYPQNYIGDYYIFICEGFSDAISVWDLGLQSMARPCCTYTDGIEDFVSYTYGGIEHIVIIPDNDDVGIKSAKQLQDMLSGLTYEDDEWEEYTDVDIFSFDGAKDIRQLIQLKGKEEVRRELNRMI